MKVIREGIAGTLESSDIQILIEPNDNVGIDVFLSSPVEVQFGHQIRQVIVETLEKLGVESATVTANDKGALDYAVVARTQAAAYRAADIGSNYEWGGKLAK